MLNEKTSYAALLRGGNRSWESVLSLAVRITAAKRSFLALHGENLFDFYYLSRGRLRIMHGSEDGAERTMLHIESGSIFNEATVLTGFDDPGCRLQCIEDCTIYRFPGVLLHDPDFVSKYPHLIIDIMKGLASKVLILHSALSDTSGDRTLQRLARFLCSLAHLNKSDVFAPGMTQEELAIFLGVHRATVVRRLNELRRCGALLCFTKKRAVIGDRQLLARIADEKTE